MITLLWKPGTYNALVRRNEDPIISSDCNSIIFKSNRDLSIGFDIFVMGIDGKNQNPLSKFAGDDSYPVIVTK